MQAWQEEEEEGRRRRQDIYLVNEVRFLYSDSGISWNDSSHLVTLTGSSQRKHNAKAYLCDMYV